MAGVGVDLGRSAITDPLTAVLGVGALVASSRRKASSVALLAAGAVVGLVHALVSASAHAERPRH